MSQIFNYSNIKINKEKGLKVFLGQNLVIHCHHYNARLQRTIEDNKLVDGKQIFKEAAKKVFYNMMIVALDHNQGQDWKILASNLYQFLGFGTLSFEKYEDGLITSDSSHFAEGWNCGAIFRKGKICSFTEGYLEGVLAAVHEQIFIIDEIHCTNEGSDQCQFIVERKLSFNNKIFELKHLEVEEPELINFSNEQKSNIDTKSIIDAVLGMPLVGNNEGLIPVFNVYLANMPQDFYNLVCVNFVNEMEKHGLKDLAKNLLIEDAEHCGINTFGGIYTSDEWDALIKPMVKSSEDNVFGLMAVANALGWGRIIVKEHIAGEKLKINSTNGYEAYGYKTLFESSDDEVCYMLRGVSAGIMELIYEKGDYHNRVNIYHLTEDKCSCVGDKLCQITVVKK